LLVLREPEAPWTGVPPDRPGYPDAPVSILRLSQYSANCTWRDFTCRAG
jgi:hypothetical protein